MKILTLLMVFVMLLSIPSVSAKEVIEKKFVDGEYKSLGDLLGIGDRVYIETYKDGSSELVFERTTNKLAKLFSKLGKATIVEYAGTLWATAPNDAPANMYVKGVNLPFVVETKPCAQTFEGMGAQFCTTHVFELYEVLGSGQGEAFLSLTKESQYPISFRMPMTMIIPGRSPSKATFTVYERVKLLTPYTDERTGTTYQYMGGSQTYSTEATFDVVWTQDTQAGVQTAKATPIQTTAPTNPNWVPSPVPVEVMIVTNPMGADVSLSGANLGKTDPSRGGLPITVSGSTERTLVLYLAGYKTVYMKVSAATISPITVDMEKLPTISITPQIPTIGCPQYVSPVPRSDGYYTSGGFDSRGCQNAAIFIPYTSTPTPSQTTPQQTSGMTLETGTDTRTPPPVPTPYDTPGFEALFAIAGLFAVAYLVLRQKPKEPDNEMD